MKKFIVFGLCLALFLTGCTGQSSPKAGDFSFDLPAGYSVTDITDHYCTIFQAEVNTPVGGIEITSLPQKYLNGKHSDNIINYLMDDFHRTNNVEWITSSWGTQNKIVVVHLDKYINDNQEESFSHIFFEKDTSVYHIWLELDHIDSDTEDQFMAMTGVD